jgi:hypothetical protein
MTSGYQRTSSPVMALPMMRRWISDVPSKMVKVLDRAAVCAGRWPSWGRGVSTHSAGVSRGGCATPPQQPCLTTSSSAGAVVGDVAGHLSDGDCAFARADLAWSLVIDTRDGQALDAAPARARVSRAKADRQCCRWSAEVEPPETLRRFTAQVDDLCAHPPRLPQRHHPRVIDLAPSAADAVAVLSARARLLCRAACPSGLAVDHRCRPVPPEIAPRRVRAQPPVVARAGTASPEGRQ